MCNNTVDPDGDVILKLEYPNDPFALESGSASTRNQSPVTFRVSSRHLALASPVFKSALTGGWKETVKTDGEHQINSQGWDTTALGIFLMAIHCQYRQVPRSLELEMLAKVAVIVDYYAAHQAIEILSPIWINTLRYQLHTTTCHNRTVALWICISWVFGDSSAFETATKVAIHHGRLNMTDFGLPIPGRVIGKNANSGTSHGFGKRGLMIFILTEDINSNRRSLVSWVFSKLNGLQIELLSDRKGCGVECRTMQLGAITRLLNSTSLSNYSFRDYQTLSIGQLLNEVESAVCPTWCEIEKKHQPFGYYNQQSTYKPHECPAPGNNFDAIVKSIAKEVNSLSHGLSITNYPKSATKSK